MLLLLEGYIAKVLILQKSKLLDCLLFYPHLFCATAIKTTILSIISGQDSRNALRKDSLRHLWRIVSTIQHLSCFCVVQVVFFQFPWSWDIVWQPMKVWNTVRAYFTCIGSCMDNMSAHPYLVSPTTDSFHANEMICQYHHIRNNCFNKNIIHFQASESCVCLFMYEWHKDVQVSFFFATNSITAFWYIALCIHRHSFIASMAASARQWNNSSSDNCFLSLKESYMLLYVHFVNTLTRTHA